MPRHPTKEPTDVELQILEVLWDRGPMTVRQVHNCLSVSRDTGYSTTLKMMQVMLEKGLLERDISVRPQQYSATEPREKTQLKMIDRLIQRAFGGSAQKLVMRMLAEDRVSAAELGEIRRLLKKHEREKP